METPRFLIGALGLDCYFHYMGMVITLMQLVSLFVSVVYVDYGLDR